jgi:hypothetical protein
MKREWLLGALAGFLAAAASASSSAQGSAEESGRYVGDFFPYEEFAGLAAERIEIGGRVLRVAFAPGELALPRETILAWVAACADAVAHYFGALPAREAALLIVPVPGRGVRGGTTYGYRGAASRILRGRDSTRADLERDWVLVHELTHHAMPFLPHDHHWMEEGLATYVEPIARAQRGRLRAESVWLDLLAGLPKGLPGEGDRGLAGTPTWGRTY